MFLSINHEHNSFTVRELTNPISDAKAGNGPKKDIAIPLLAETRLR